MILFDLFDSLFGDWDSFDSNIVVELLEFVETGLDSVLADVVLGEIELAG